MLRVAVLTALLLAVAGAPASATGATFTWLSCAGTTGEITGLYSGPSEPDGTVYALAHTMTPCTTPSPTNVYGVVMYDAAGPVWGFPVVYPPSGMPVAAEVGLQPAMVAICLVAAPTRPVDCAGIVAGADGLLALGPEIPVTSPIVSTPFKFLPSMMQAPERPLCPSCSW